MSSFQSLDNSKTQLPASAFPKPADVYVCDDCGRDITRRFRPGRAPVWKPMGTEIFECLCGQKYLTGATEWDHLGDWERRRRLEQIFGLGILFSAFFLVPGLVVYFTLHRPRTAFITAFCIAALPFSLMFVPFSLEVAASMWRMRTSGTGSERIH
jgi:hypothetical protein